MKRLHGGIVGAVLLMLSIAGLATGQDKTLRGEITDEHLNCEQTPMKATEGIKDKWSCVLYWAHYVQPLSKLVLYDAATKTIYQLDDQNLVLPYVGEHVEVTGTLNDATKTIKIKGIKVPDSDTKES